VGQVEGVADTKPLSQYDCAALIRPASCSAGTARGTWCWCATDSPVRWVPSPHAFAWPGHLKGCAPKCSSAYLQRDALQFEWAWQHPHVSIAVRDVAATLPKRGLSGIKGKVHIPDGCITAIAHTNHLLLTTQDDVLTRYSNHVAWPCRLQFLSAGVLQAVPDTTVGLLATSFF
jgi:hypothetical protein